MFFMLCNSSSFVSSRFPKYLILAEGIVALLVNINIRMLATTLQK